MKKQYWLRYVLACALTFGCTANLLADEVVVEDDAASQEEPAYQNQAQAMHDANLEAAAFEKIDAEMAALQDERDAALAVGDLARVAVIDAELVEKANERTGIEDGRIADLRASGMGWGDIAHELGVHPGVLGLGHSKSQAKGLKSTPDTLISDEEIRVATAINLNSGMTKGHGYGNDKGFSGSKKENKGRAGEDGSEGKGKDKSDKGNNGNNGNDGNNGGGKGKS